METSRVLAALVAGLACMKVSAAPPHEMELPSCVTGSPPLRAGVQAERALLDAGDRARFDAAAQARYPLYQRGGLVPAQVMLLRRGGQWQYVTLRRGGSTGLCVVAVFAAERFDFTPGWVAKYRPQPGDPQD